MFDIRWIIKIFFCSWLFLGANSAYAQQEANANTSSTNSITKTAVELGVLTCAARIQQVTSYLGADQNTAASLRRPANPTDQNSFSVTMAVEGADGPAVALIDFFPVGQSCKATYYLSIQSNANCSDLETNSFGNLNEKINLAETILKLDGPGTTRFVLVDNASGCTVIRSETID